MPGTKEVRTKIKSVQNTRKITKAMEMVAASKMRKAHPSLAQQRPAASAHEDGQIKVSITDRFLLRARQLLMAVSVDVYRGVVMLTGAVEEAGEREKAVRIAGGVRDVRRVSTRSR